MPANEHAQAKFDNISDWGVSALEGASGPLPKKASVLLLRTFGCQCSQPNEIWLLNVPVRISLRQKTLRPPEPR